ncbi:MAG TPA: hypothetical protein VNF99_04330 [Stellaceae bacterium]|nr:hypothetical protein [Stellaceae bacterium]
MKSFRLIVAVIAVSLGGCSTSAPVLLNASAEGLVVRYNQSDATSADATAAAQNYCARYGRKAVPGEGSEQTGDTFVAYTCQKP